MPATRAEPCTFIIFGGTGDLSQRKLLPALARLNAGARLHERSQIVGVGRSPVSDDAFRDAARASLLRAGLTAEEASPMVKRIHYQQLGDGTAADYAALRTRLESIEAAAGSPANRVFYMSLPPGAFEPTVQGLGGAHLNTSSGWTRIVVEKPFGTDLASAQVLNKIVHAHFKEDQIYRIDHYLGKETVQNLLVFRLANAFIESSWNRERIEAVQITVAEDLGVGSRAQYYDGSGALRDMLQNHITQLLTLVAMEVPASFSARAIRYEKIKVLNSIKPIDLADVVRGQYTAGDIKGERVKGYLDEAGVPPNSQTETFIAARLFVDSWRWQGVPFYVRTGKRLPYKTTQIAVKYRGAPVGFFDQMGARQVSNMLAITLQPDEGFTFHLGIKGPGSPPKLEQIPLRFSYDSHFPNQIPDAYQTLLLDVILGDQTLFVHADEVEESWSLYAPLLQNPPPVCDYRAGTWGPREAEALAIPGRELRERRQAER